MWFISASFKQIDTKLSEVRRNARGNCKFRYCHRRENRKMAEWNTGLYFRWRKACSLRVFLAYTQTNV